MEEILSSIRRIIADEAPDDESEQGAAGTQAQTRDRDANQPADGAKGGDPDDEDVLELTEVVREDSLEREPLEAGPGNADKADPDEQERAAQRDQEGDPKSEAGEELAAPDRSAAKTSADENAAQSPMDIRDDAMEPHQTTTQKKNGIETLVSDRAAGAATGAFAKLSQAVQRTPPEVAIADGSGRSVEQFVEDMMRPMLRDWLEEHLPPLVERIVQKEIQKIVRRAEDDLT
jgi:cell pole-organizing protein PopZ